MKIENYYLDLNKVFSLNNENREKQVHSYYTDMLFHNSQGDVEMTQSIMMTLINAEFLLEIRDEKLKIILDE